MKQLIQDFKTGQLRVVDVPSPALQTGCVLVRNSFSLVSAGTERSTVTTAQKSLLGKARARPDLVRKVWDSVKREGFASAAKKVQSRLDTWKQLGYSSAGVVTEVGEGINDLKKDDRVACAGQDVASHAEIICVPRNLCVKIPDGVEFGQAAFTTLGAIAMQGVRQAKVELGETIAVIGLGLVGQLTVQILKAAGTRVLGIDVNPDATALAAQCGADAVATRGKDDPVSIAKALTNGHGVDAVLITASTSSNDPVELAAQLSRDRGRVIMVGVTGMNIPRAPYFEKELSFSLSRSYGPGRYDPDYEQKGIDYPFGYVRWTENRNMSAFLDLIAQKKINLLPLITHQFPIDRAVEAYDLITGKKPEKFLGVLIQYETGRTTEPVSHTPKHSALSTQHSALRLGVIGAGNYAQASLLPHLKKMKEVEFISVCTATGVSAQKTSEKFGFANATTNPRDVLDDKSINAVLIATRHNSHAQLAAAALQAGKHVFVEKPIALNEEQLKLVADAVKQHGEKLQVGFNRRFAPLTHEALKNKGGGPWVIHYRVNAGPIPATSWIQDPKIGGGRILGEVCHFVDFFQAFVGAKPSRVFAECLASPSKDIIATDNVHVTIRYADGSVGLITYTSTGDPSFPKERCEIFGNGTVMVLDDFRSLTISKDGKTETKRGTQDKGQAGELSAFVKAASSGGKMPIPWLEMEDTTRVTFAILESLRTGSAIGV
ncbi:MAG: oxidoreductase [Verrucomicrobiae bacterium]|nr:oxidoreductase [Verrucomicrobiae bacterium]